MLSRLRIPLTLIAFALSGCDCELEPLQGVPGRVGGILCEADSGLHAAAMKLDVDPARGDVLHGETDATGNFLVERAPIGRATVRWEDREVEVKVESGKTATVRDPACRDLPPGPGFGDIVGTICNRHTGEVLQHATVTVPLDDSLGGDRTATTDDDGNFRVWDVPVGEQIVIVSGDGFQRSWQVTVVDGGVTELDNAGDDCRSPGADEGMVNGALCDPENTGPLAGAQVTGVDVDERVHEDVTDVDGTFLLGPMPPGPVQIDVVRGDLHIELTALVRAGEEAQVTNGGACVVETCNETLVETQAATELMFVVDRSGSMRSGAPGYSGTRWEGIVNAVTGVSSQLEEHVAFGVSLYPSLDSNECGTAAPYLAPALDNAESIDELLTGFDSSPAGATPTARALQDLLAWHQQNPTDRSRAVLLATDGGPNCNSSLDPFTCECSSGDDQCATSGDAYLCLDDVAAVDAVAALHDAGLDTYIIGIPGVEMFGWVLDDMASAGGTGHHYPARDSATLESAVIDIVRRAGGCTLDVDDDVADAARVEVIIDGVPVAYDPDAADGYGIVDEHSVELYGAACEAYLSAGSASLGLCTIEGD